MDMLPFPSPESPAALCPELQPDTARGGGEREGEDRPAEGARQGGRRERERVEGGRGYSESTIATCTIEVENLSRGDKYKMCVNNVTCACVSWIERERH